MKTYTFHASVQDIKDLHSLIMEKVEKDGDNGGLLNDFDKQLLNTLAAHEKEERRLRHVRDCNIMYYVGKLLDGNGPAVCYSERQKIQFANDVIRAHNLYIKACWGEA